MKGNMTPALKEKMKKYLFGDVERIWAGLMKERIVKIYFYDLG